MVRKLFLEMLHYQHSFVYQKTAAVSFLLDFLFLNFSAPKNVKEKCYYMCFVCIHEHFQNTLCEKLVITYSVIISKRILCEISENSHQSSEIVSLCLSQICWSTLKLRSSLTTDGWLLCFSSWKFVCQSLINILHSCLTFLHSYFGCKLQIIHNVFAAFMFLMWREQIRMWISWLAGYESQDTSHSAETRTNTTLPVMWWFVGQWVMWCYLACMSSCPVPTLAAWNKRWLLPNSSHIICGWVTYNLSSCGTCKSSHNHDYTCHSCSQHAASLC